MLSDPISNFPLLAADQADVIRIFIELMRDRDFAEGASKAATSSQPLERLYDSNHSGFPNELLDLGE